MLWVATSRVSRAASVFKLCFFFQVFGEQDEDGFFWGQCKLKQGLVPSNMIHELSSDEAEQLFNEAKNDVRLHNTHGQANGELDVDVISEGPSDRKSFWENFKYDLNFAPRKMKTLYEYDPMKDSPNVDSEVRKIMLLCSHPQSLPFELAMVTCGERL